MVYALTTVQNNAYRGPIRFKNVGYYIHLHQENIGRAQAEDKSEDFTKKYAKYKKENYDLMKEYFFKLFYANNTPSTKSKAVLDEVFNGTNEKLFTEVEQEITEKLQQSLDQAESIKSLYQKETELFNNNQQYFQDIITKKGGGQNEIKSFENLLEVLASCCKLIKGEEGSALAASLLLFQNDKNFQIQKQQGVSLQKTFGKYLSDAIQHFKLNNELKSIKENQINHAVAALEVLARDLYQGKTSSGKNLTISSFKNVLDYVFNTGFAESVGGIFDNIAGKAVGNFELNIDKMVAEMTGDKKVSAYNIDSSDKQIRPLDDSTESFGKADIIGSNFLFHLESLGNRNGGMINLKLGFSNKLYRSQGFPGIEGTKDLGKIGLNAGGSFVEALNALFGYEISYNKYLAYNIITHQNASAERLNILKLQDLILTRQFLSIASSRGGISDFAEYIIVNGTLISIWQLILSLKSFSGLSSSMFGNNQPVSLSIKGRELLNGKNNFTIGQYNRVKGINDIINNQLKITAYLHLKKCAEMMKRI